MADDTSPYKRARAYMMQWLVLFLIPGFLAFQFEEDEARCPPDSSCLIVSECTFYQDRQRLQKHRPTPCAFQGTTPLICCPAPLYSCGNPNRTIYSPFGFASTPDPPDNSIGRPVFQHGSPPDRHKRSAERTEPSMGGPHAIGVPDKPPYNEIQTATGIGGVDAVPGQWPWIALLGRLINKQLGDWFCGGSLITPRHVLTAGHCLVEFSATEMGARIGDHDLSTEEEVRHQERLVLRVVRHERYRPELNDIGLVTLERPVRISEAVRPVCLPPPQLRISPDDPVSMAGWGLLEYKGNVPDILQEVPLKLVDIGHCEKTYRQLPSFVEKYHAGFQSTKVCAASIDGEIRGACHGDSGGPLMAHDSQGFSYVVGIVSYGMGCGNPDFPGVYTRVSAYLDWIRQKVQ